jgi:hypothetical protein
MKRIALILALTIALAKGAIAGGLEIVNATVRPTLTLTATTSAAYLTIINSDANTDDKLIAASSPAATMLHLHETKVDGDVASMVMMNELVLPPNSTTRFEPGGLHIMLMGIKQPLKVGDKVELLLSFEKAGEIKILADVRLN